MLKIYQDAVQEAPDKFLTQKNAENIDASCQASSPDQDGVSLVLSELCRAPDYAELGIAATPLAVDAWTYAAARVDCPARSRPHAIQRALPGSPWRRGILFGLMVRGFWVISGTFSAIVWLAIPISLAGANIVFGLPKCLVIGCGIAWSFHRIFAIELIELAPVSPVAKVD